MTKQETTINEIARIRQADHRARSIGVSNALTKHLEDYAGHPITVGELNEDFFFAFKDFLMQKPTVSSSSARTYLQKLHAIVEECVQQNQLSYNPMPRISRLVPSQHTPQRTFLTTRELRKLAATPCRTPSVMQAFLLACYTGLRISDIETLQWGDLRRVNGTWMLQKSQVKTRNEVKVPLSREAQSLLKEIGWKSGGEVFSLPSRVTINAELRRWALAAGVEKHLSFHVARHTFATMLINANVGIMTVSKLCGHTRVATTEIYTHLVDSTLCDGIERMSKALKHCMRTEKAATP